MGLLQSCHLIHEFHIEMLAHERRQLVVFGVLVDVVTGSRQSHPFEACDVFQNRAAEGAVMEQSVQIRA